MSDPSHKISIPERIGTVLGPPRGEARYRVLHGGRGSGKSYTAALVAAVWGLAEPLRILCAREFQASIRESMFAEIASAIANTPVLAEHYDVGRDYIRCRNGTEFIFRGLRHNIQSIKSMAQVDLCIVEEAEDVPPLSWTSLLPTIRAERSEIWAIFNPRSRDSWVAKTFLGTEGKPPPPRTLLAEVNHCDNPWFPDVLWEQMKHDRTTADPALFAHIWEGAFYEESDAVIFAGKYRVAEIEPVGGSVYYGLDFGFAVDPTAANRVVVADDTIFITHEMNGLQMELDYTAQAIIDALPDVEKYLIVADSARPESISYLRRSVGGRPHLRRIVATKKGKGSVADGIALMKSFKEIVIHPRCKHTIKEFMLYSYKTDRNTGIPTPDIVDAHNHHIDAIRYALEPLMRSAGRGLGLKR